MAVNAPKSSLRASFSRLGLWPRVAMAVTLGFGALYLAFLFLSERALKESTDRLIDQRLLITQIAAAHVDSYLEQSLIALQSTERHVDFESGYSDLANVARILDTEGQLSIFSPGIMLIDPDGHSIQSKPADLLPPGTDVSELPYFAQALKPDQTTFSDPFFTPYFEHPVVAVTMPLEHSGHLFGYLSGLIDLRGENFLGPLAKAATLSESEHAAVVDEHGRVVVSTFYIDPLSAGEHHTFYVDAMKARVATVATVPFEMELPGEVLGHLHIMAFVPLENVPWGITVGGDEAEILANVRQLRTGMVIVGIAALIGVWLITLIGTRRLVHPVQQLTKAANKIAEGDLSVRLISPEGGEIGILADSLDRMRLQLLVHIEELAALNDTLESRVAIQTEDLRRQQELTEKLLHQLINVQEGERQRVARELHDEIGQTLTAVELSLGHLANALPAGSKEARRRLEQSRSLTEQTVADLRVIITALRPGTLDELGLVPALDWMSDHSLRPEGVQVTIDADNLGERLPKEIETTLFRIAQEAMSNVGRHGQATLVEILLERRHGEIIMVLRDNGRGFQLMQTSTMKDSVARMGIAGMQERALLAGGKLTVYSAPGQGTTISVVIPVQDEINLGEYHGQPTN